MTEAEIYKQVSRELEIPLDKVIAYDKALWNHMKSSLNNPYFDVLELPEFGTWVIISSRMRSTLKFELRRLRSIKKGYKKFPNSLKHKNQYEDGCKLFRSLWKLKQKLKMH